MAHYGIERLHLAIILRPDTCLACLEPLGSPLHYELCLEGQ